MGAHFLLFVLATASKALKAEAALQAAGLQCALIPVPRTLTARCGVCLRVPAADRQRAEALLSECGAEIAEVHEIDGSALKRRPSTKETP
jgi:hypothetical protein